MDKKITGQPDNDGYQVTAIGRQTAEKYADIINLPRPELHHVRMDPVKRAKIFAPFDALHGYDEAIDELDERTNDVVREDLSEDETEKISKELGSLQKGNKVEVRYFLPTSSSDIGFYRTIKGIIAKIDIVEQYIRISDAADSYTDISFRDMTSIQRC